MDTSVNVLVVAATISEIRPFLDQLRFLSKEDEKLSCFQYGNMGVDVLVPGIGMVPTAYYTGRCLLQKNYTLAINAGIAGAYPDHLKIGTVVEVTEDCISGLGAEDDEMLVSVFELGLADPDEFPYQSGRLVNVYPVKENPVLEQLPKVKGNTVNTIYAEKHMIEKILRASKADIESMEGAAFLYACLNQKIKNVQIRSISNFVTERDKSKWDLKKSIRNLNDVLIRFLHNIS